MPSRDGILRKYRGMSTGRGHPYPGFTTRGPSTNANAVATIIDGKAVAAQVRDEVRRDVEAFRCEHGYAPSLATVLVGDNAASATYVRSKRKACAEVGITSIPHELPADTTQADLDHLVHTLNARADVHGILVQLPLPAHVDTDAVLTAIHPDKDVDGLHPTNQARLLMGQDGLRPCTPLGVMRLIATTDTVLWRKGEVLLVVVSRFFKFDADNAVRFDGTPSDPTCAAIYRTRGLLLLASQ